MTREREEKYTKIKDPLVGGGRHIPRMPISVYISIYTLYILCHLYIVAEVAIVSGLHVFEMYENTL